MATFSDFWEAYPRRKGANPRMPAEKKFNAAVQKGADTSHIISSVVRYRDELKEQGLLDTPYVCMAQTWLNQQRWLDYAPDPASEKRISAGDEFMKSKGWGWSQSDERWVKIRPDAEDLL